MFERTCVVRNVVVVPVSPKLQTLKTNISVTVLQVKPYKTRDHRMF